MMNIKYLDNKIKQKVDNFFKKDKLYKEVLIKLINKWNIEKPIIKDFSLEYDFLSFYIVDKYSIVYEIKIDLLLDSANVFQTKKHFYKNYKIIDDILEIDTKGYIKNNQKLERIYRDDDILEYNFQNDKLNSKIYIVLGDDLKLDEVSLIKTLLESKDIIQDITSLYIKLSSILKIEKIRIDNINQGFDERILVVNDNLMEYKRCIFKESGLEYLDYHDGKIFVTREEVDSLELQKMKKIIK